MLQTEETPRFGDTEKKTRAPRKVARRTSQRRRPTTPWDDDRELVNAILGGSREHFELLYSAYFQRVYWFALKRLGDPAEAEDVSQEVFVTVFRCLETWAGNSSLLVWIFGITRNKVHRRFRGMRPRMESIDQETVSNLAAADAPTDQRVDARLMLEQCEFALANHLTPLQRRIFHLKHLRRQSIRTIATSLGKSEDAIKANLYRMRKALAEAAPGLESVLAG
ncbi:MAG: RNA polymerase sigma factor [Myxococcales bacterium]|nr:RNA polymerase sigma factor [Myxococcales bacterium]